MPIPYSSQFVLQTVPAAGVDPIYVVPANEIAIIQDIEASNDGGADDTIGFAFDTATVNVLPIKLFVPSGAPSAQWHGKVVLNPGDTLSIFPGVSDWDVIVSGALLEI